MAQRTGTRDTPRRILGAAALGLAALLAAACGSTEASSGTGPGSPTPGTGVIVGQISSAMVLANKPSPELVKLAGITPEMAEAGVVAASKLPWKLVKAGGVTQAVACTGSGGPTVVYLNGLLVPGSWTWPLVAQEQSKTSRVCLFDRPGTGMSPPRPSSATNGPVANANEMTAMLTALGEPGPYLLVGWSYGGLVARTAAAQRPDQTAALVLVDSVLPDQYRTFDTRGWTEADMPLDMAGAEKAVQAGAPLTPKPVVVLQAGVERSASTGLPGSGGGAIWTAGQQAATDLSTNSVYGIVTGSEHQIPIQAPQAVVAGTNAALASIAADNAAMPECPPSFAAAGIACQPN